MLLSISVKAALPTFDDNSSFFYCSSWVYFSFRKQVVNKWAIQ